jgi:hypothetical protein
MMPFDLRLGQKKWIEIFQITDSRGLPEHWFHLPSSRASFVPVSGMVMSFVIYGAGAPIRFSITFARNAEDQWAAKLIGSDGSEQEQEITAYFSTQPLDHRGRRRNL